MNLTGELEAAELVRRAPSDSRAVRHALRMARTEPALGHGATLLLAYFGTPRVLLQVRTRRVRHR